MRTTVHRRNLPWKKDHEEARRIAEESMVLLKNADQILPLKTSEKVAFVGGFAKKPRFQGGGSSHINCFKITNALDSVPSDAQVTYAEVFLQTKISTMTHLQLKRSKLLPPLTRL